ncbi:hypothetical protein Hanom_Chr17g01557611 [Helianthus anomalus]
MNSVSGFGGCKALATPLQRRTKARSGLLGGSPGVAYFSNYSPVVPVLVGESNVSFPLRLELEF